MALVMDIASVKIIKSNRQIKNRYIGNFMFMSFAAGVFCILYSVFCTACCEFYVIFRAHPFQWPSAPPPPLSSSPFVQNNLEINSDMKSAARYASGTYKGSQLSRGLKNPEVI